MSTRHLVDPELYPLLELMPGFPFTRDALPLIREQAEGRFAFLGDPPLPPVIKTIEGPDGPLDVYWYDPAPGAAMRPALFHIHGGGMVIGSARSMQHGPSGMANALGIPVVSIKYRLAPEHPFPAPQQDCLAGLSWMIGHAAELGVDPRRVGIIGESAGGGLAAAVAKMARDLGGPHLAAQFLIYPMLDHRTGGKDCRHNNPTTGEFIWTRQANGFGWEALRGSYQLDDNRIGWFSPARSDDLSGLPPTWIGTGSLDLFFDENLDYARRLTATGVAVELHSYPGAVHAFNAVAESALAKAFTRDMLAAISRMLGVGRA